MNSQETQIKKRKRISFALRVAIASCLSLTILFSLLLIIVVGLKNLLSGFDAYTRASIDDGIALATRYCHISAKTVTEKLPDWLTKRNSTLPPDLQMNRVQFAVFKIEIEAEGFLNVEFSQEASLLSGLSGVNKENLVQFSRALPPRSELWPGEASDFEGDTLKMDASLAVFRALEAIGNYYWSKIQDENNLDRYINIWESTRHSIRGRFVELSTNGNCDWTLSRTTETSVLGLIRNIVVAASNSGLVHPRDSYPYFDAWGGQYVFAFSNKAIEGVVSPGRLLISIPIYRAEVVARNVVIITLLSWIIFAFVLGALGVWLAIRPLLLLERSTREAGEFLHVDKDTPKRLINLADYIKAHTSGFDDYEELLRNLAGLLQDREYWLGTMLHNLKNDVHAVVMNLGNVQRTSVIMEPAFARANEGVFRLRDMLNNVTTFQWTMFDGSEKNAVIDVGSILVTIVDSVEDAGGEVLYNTDNNLYVLGQKAALHSAIQNLVWNAHYHGGGIEVRAKIIEGGRSLNILIDDDGPGIEDGLVEELFKPYRQGEGRSSDERRGNFRGAGLGLTIARRVITSHGGRITISNRKTVNGNVEGLRVSVVLPLYK